MSKMKRIVFIVLLLIVAAFGCFFPKFYCKWQDEKLIGVQKSVATQQTHLSYKANLTCMEKMIMMDQASEGEYNIRVVGDNRSNFDFEVNNLDRYMTNQISKLYVYDFFPNVPSYNFSKDLISAKYVFLFNSQTSNASETFGFWVIRCSDRKNYDFTMCLDGENYTLYGAKLYSKTMGTYMNNNSQLLSVSDIAQGLKNYYSFGEASIEVDDSVFPQFSDFEDESGTYDAKGGELTIYGDDFTSFQFVYQSLKRDKSVLVKYNGLEFGSKAIWDVVERVKKY